MKITLHLLLSTYLFISVAPATAAEPDHVSWHQEIPESEVVRAQRMAFAQSELDTLLAPYGNDLSKATWKIDPGMAPFSFAYSRRDGVWEFRAPSAQGLVQAVYPALEDAGYRFYVTGPEAPGKLTLDLVPTENKVVTPGTRLRGVRQHINFNMDVSSWPVAEAKEYIRNLARQNYNFMSFHSYPCHWTRDKLSHGALFGDFGAWTSKLGLPPDELIAGGYFYGGEFLIPNHPLIRPYIRFNKSYFTAPEFEEAIHKHPERGEKAREWLREIMAEAKRSGMTILMSTELVDIDEKYNTGLLDRMVADYPEIDYLEVISAEAADPKKEYIAENIAMAREIVEGVSDAELNKKFKHGSLKQPLTAQLRNYALNMRTIRALRNQGWEKKNGVILVCGSYACRPHTISAQMELAKEYLPNDVPLACMPGHSSLNVLSNIKEADISPEMLRRTLINSWIEFDGYMMLQQHAARGFFALGDYLREKTGDKQISAIAANHWRTAPNAPTFRYFGEWNRDAGRTPEAFYASTAADFGISGDKVPVYANVMREIDELSDASAIAGNIGFNLSWEINKQSRSIGNIWWWGRPQLEKGLARFETLHDQIKTLQQEKLTPAGRKQISQLEAGVHNSMSHLKGVLALKEATDIGFDPPTRKFRSNLTEAEKDSISAACTKAEKYFQDYLKTLVANLSDRGEEGMLITYYYGPLLMANNIRALIGGQGKFIDRKDEGSVVPLPLTTEDEGKIGSSLF
jgi:hypothetical protein